MTDAPQAPAEAEAPNQPKAKIAPGTATWEGGKIVFKGGDNERVKSVVQDINLFDAEQKLQVALETVAQQEKNNEAIEKVLAAMSRGRQLGTFTHPDANITNDERILVDKVGMKYAPEEMKAYAAQRAKAGEMYNELRNAQHEVLKQVLKGEVKVVGAENIEEEAIGKAVKAFRSESVTIDRIHKPNFYKNAFPNLREKGIAPALKAGFGLEAIKEAPMKFAMRAGLTTVGVIMVGDSLRSQSKDKDGKLEKRSFVARVTEGVTGATLAAGAALHGR